MTYADDRDVRAFESLEFGKKKEAMQRWGDIYTWYVCEKTNIIAAALREGYKPYDIANTYHIKQEAVAKCVPLK